MHGGKTPGGGRQDADGTDYYYQAKWSSETGALSGNFHSADCQINGRVSLTIYTAIQKKVALDGGNGLLFYFSDTGRIR